MTAYPISVLKPLCFSRQNVHTGLSPEQVAPLVQRLGQYAVETGRNVETLFIGIIATGQMTRERLHQYRDAGVQHLVVRFPTVAPEGLETALGELRERLVVPAQSL